MRKLFFCLLSLFFYLTVFADANPILATCIRADRCDACINNSQTCAGIDNMRHDICIVYQSCDLPQNNDSCNCSGRVGSYNYTLVNCAEGSLCAGMLGSNGSAMTCFYCRTYVSTPTLPPEVPVTPTPPPPPRTTITPTSPPGLECNNSYGVCGCVPGKGCQNGKQTDYRCCYRTCDLVKQQCVTIFGQGRANTCDSIDPNIADPKCITAANYNGFCTISGNQATFRVSGNKCPVSNPKCSRADYTSGNHTGEAAWEAQAVPFSHSVFPNERFTWYVNGKSSSAICKISDKTQCGQEGCITDDDCDPTYQCEDRCQ